MRFKLRSILYPVILGIWSSILLLGCTPYITRTNTNNPSTKTTTSSSAVMLHYEGPEPGTDIATSCALLDLDESNTVTLTSCAGTMSTQTLGPRASEEWNALRNRLGNFTLTTATASIAVQGDGTETDAAWQRAALAWASITHAELATGRASATGRTALSWFFAPLPETPETCTHLTVRNDGYAYAERVPCAGGAVIASTGDWLTTAELVQFDGWLYGRAPLYLDQNYLDGRGDTAMDATETAAVAQWATDVFTRIAAQLPQ